ncbi:hypothetical protein SO3561_09666 [Streptomyces olivochromogenes]|uniref:Uncharacterized protein n=1 Tax=Streptomyces olivochromogenes TaxID=1963 RepID=A0A250VVG5_STROL|nr:hypothetical protein SO3561_09666 [Streptomyces olivochromogenes]
MSCDEVLRLLREREAACHSEAERLGAEAERLMVQPVMCEQEPARISTACDVVGELPRIEPVPAIPTGSTAMIPDPAPGWTSAGHRGSGTSACGTGLVCRSSVLSAGSGGSWSGGGAPPDGSDPASFEEGRCGEADGADSGRVVHRDAWHGRGERVNVRQEDGLLLVGRVDLPDRAREKTWWHLMCPSPANAFTASRIRVEEILAHLSDLVMMTCTQDVSEDYVTVAGRVLVQDQLDILAAAPPGCDRLGTGGCSCARSVGTCGSWPPPSGAWTSLGSRTARRRRICTYLAARIDAELLVLTCDATGVNMIPSWLGDTTHVTAETHAAASLPQAFRCLPKERRAVPWPADVSERCFAPTAGRCHERASSVTER